MIGPEKIAHVKQLAQSQSGLSLREISRQTGVNRMAVKRIVEGTYRPKSTVDEERYPPARCDTCGYVVTMPCVYCRAMGHRKP